MQDSTGDKVQGGQDGDDDRGECSHRHAHSGTFSSTDPVPMSGSGACDMPAAQNLPASSIPPSAPGLGSSASKSNKSQKRRAEPALGASASTNKSQKRRAEPTLGASASTSRKKGTGLRRDHAQGSASKKRKRSRSRMRQDDYADTGWRSFDIESQMEEDARQNRCRFPEFAMYVKPPPTPTLQNINQWTVVDKTEPGAVLSSRIVQSWRKSGRIGPRTASAPESRPEINHVLDRFSSARAQGLLLGTSHNKNGIYQAHCEQFALKYFTSVYDDEKDQPVDKQSSICLYIAYLLKCEEVCKMDPIAQAAAIQEHADLPIVALPEEIVSCLFDACMRQKTDVNEAGIHGLARERTKKDPATAPIGFPTLLAFDQAITSIHSFAGLPTPSDLPAPRDFRMRARKQHVTKHHQWLDFDTDLELMYEAVMKSQWTTVEKV